MKLTRDERGETRDVSAVASAGTMSAAAFHDSCPASRVLGRVSRFPSPVSRGFTLVELVAAFVIFAIGFGVLLQILSTCLHSTAQSTDYTRVALWAQSLLDTQGVGEPLQEGSFVGKFDDRYSWRLNVQKIPVPDEPAAPVAGNANMPQLQMTQVGANPVDLYQLELVVSWGGYYLTHNARFVTWRSQNSELNDPNNPNGPAVNPMLGKPGANRPVRSSR